MMNREEKLIVALKGGAKKTLKQLSEETGYPEASVSCGLRVLRNVHNKDVCKEYIGDRTYAYFIKTTKDLVKAAFSAWSKPSTPGDDLANYVANYMNAELAKQQQQELSDIQRKLVSEGWTAWFGGECPINTDAIVDIWLSNNEMHCSRAGSWAWNKKQTLGIIAYRLHKPAWKMPDPPPGKQWHRADWVEDMLPEGWRANLLGEKVEDGDEIYVDGNWLRQSKIQLANRAESETYHCRTRRPLPVEPRVVPWTRETIPALPFEVRVKSNENRFCVLAAVGNYVLISAGVAQRCSYKNLLLAYTRADGSPCGEVQP